MLFSNYKYYAKPANKAACSALMNGLTLMGVKDPAPVTIVVDELPVSDVYRVPEQVLGYLRDSPLALDFMVFFDYPGHGVRRFESYSHLVHQSREQRAAA